MAWKIYKIDLQPTNLNYQFQEGVGHLFVDTAADLPTISDIQSVAGFTPIVGTDALDVSTGAQYRINSSGTWHLQTVSNADIIAQLSALQTELASVRTVADNAQSDAQSAQDGVDALETAVKAAYEYDTATEYTIESGSDLDDFSYPGAFVCVNAATAATILNTPYTNAGFRLEVRRIAGTAGASNFRGVQTLYPNLSSTTGYGLFYYRTRVSSGWTSWFLFQGTAVATVNTNSLNSSPLLAGIYNLNMEKENLVSNEPLENNEVLTEE